MEFKNAITQLSTRVKNLKKEVDTEEATKNAFVMPFIQSLGYDVFNPLEVIPEFTCDIGTKKGEKVDYAIMGDDKPTMLIECKHWSQDLDLHDNQLIRYYSASNAHFGVLTNGIIYRFYADLKEKNKMDTKPFFEIDLSNPKDYQITELKKFHKIHFDLNSIFDTASNLKYTNELRTVINNEFNDPSPEFVRFFARSVYDGIINQRRLDEFTPLVKKSISTHISDLLTNRIQSLLVEEKKEEVKDAVEVETSDIDSRIVTTEEELEGFMIIRAILRRTVDISRVVYRDAISYFSILFDDNNRKPICRLHFHGNQKYITIFDRTKEGIRHNIESLDNIYDYAEELKDIGKFYLEQD